MSRCGILSLLLAINMVAGIGAIDCNNPPKRTDLMACCPHDDLISQQIADKCKSFLGQGAPAGMHKQLLNACYLECAVNETGIMNGINVNQIKLETYLTTVLGRNPDILPIVQTAFATCSQKLKELQETMKEHPSEVQAAAYGDCKPCMGVLMYCVNMETIYNCPASIWKASEECNSSREFFRTCMPSLGQHPH